MIKVLIADDDESILWVLEKLLTGKGLEVIKAKDGTEAGKGLADNPVSIAVLDINMPGKDGLKLLTEANKTRSDASYITKPCDLNEMEIVSERAIENLKLKEKVSALKERLRESLSQETAFIGKSKAVEDVFKKAGKIA